MVITTGVRCVLSQIMLSNTAYMNLEFEILALSVEGKKTANIK